MGVRELRESAGLSQAELAGHIGLSQPNISAYESGTRRPSRQTLDAIAAACRPRPSAVLSAHREELLRIAAEHRASNVRVFGSVARHEDTTQSDLDLLVAFEDDASMLDLVALADAVEKCLGVKVDIVSEGGLGQRNHSIIMEAVPV